VVEAVVEVEVVEVEAVEVVVDMVVDMVQAEVVEVASARVDMDVLCILYGEALVIRADGVDGVGQVDTLITITHTIAQIAMNTGNVPAGERTKNPHPLRCHQRPFHQPALLKNRYKINVIYSSSIVESISFLFLFRNIR
jgi:hypothetical protein